MNTIEKIWKETLTEIELEISRPNFNTWFKKTFPLKQEGSVFYVGVPNEFNKEWLYTKFHKTILEKIKKFDDSIRSVEYIVKKKTDTHSTVNGNTNTFTEVIEKNTLPLERIAINKNSNLNEKYSFQSFVVGPFNELDRKSVV